jgi:hypothetical protein
VDATVFSLTLGLTDVVLKGVSFFLGGGVKKLRTIRLFRNRKKQIIICF